MIGWPFWMEWEGREQRPSCYDIFLFVLGSGVSWKATQKILLNLTKIWDLSEVFILLILFFKCGKIYILKFARSSLKVSASLEFLICRSNFLSAFEVTLHCQLLFSRLAMLIMLQQPAFHLTKPDGLLLTSGCHVSYNYSVDTVTRRTFYK